MMENKHTSKDFIKALSKARGKIGDMSLLIQCFARHREMFAEYSI